MSNTFVITGADVYTAGAIIQADVHVENGIIHAIGKNLGENLPHDVQRINGTGYILSPGFVDIHTHLREPGFSYKETIETGTRAGAAGGFTTLCTMPNLSPVPDSLPHLNEQLDIIRTSAHVQVLPFASISIGEKGEALADISSMAPYCIGFSDDGKGVQSDALMEAAMKEIAKTGLFLSAHCEDESLLPKGGSVHAGIASSRFSVPGIPSESEWKQIERDLKLVAKTGVRYHVCHISAKESVSLIKEAKKQGLPVSCECTPHQLFFCDEDITQNHGRFKMNPPLRSREDQMAIIEGLLNGTIDCIATDHAPHSEAEKAQGLQGSNFGVVGLETAFAACYTALVNKGLYSLDFLLEKMTLAPAAIIGKTHGIAVGNRADLTLIDINAAARVDASRFVSKGRSSPFDSLMLTGQVASTFVQGKNVFRREERA